MSTTNDTSPERLALQDRMEMYELYKLALQYAAGLNPNSSPAAKRILKRDFDLEVSEADVDVERRQLTIDAQRAIRALVAKRQARKGAK